MNEQPKQQKKATISFGDTLKVYEFLKDQSVLKLVDAAAKTYQYQSHWNDRVVASHFSVVLNKTVTMHNVAGLRCREFGQLVGATSSSTTTAELLERIYELTARVDKLERAMALTNHNL